MQQRVGLSPSLITLSQESDQQVPTSNVFFFALAFQFLVTYLLVSSFFYVIPSVGWSVQRLRHGLCSFRAPLPSPRESALFLVLFD